jgi:hypothetical protein
LNSLAQSSGNPALEFNWINARQASRRRPRAIASEAKPA